MISINLVSTVMTFFIAKAYKDWSSNMVAINQIPPILVQGLSYIALDSYTNLRRHIFSDLHLHTFLQDGEYFQTAVNVGKGGKSE